MFYRNFLKRANFLTYLLIGLVAAVLQSTIFQSGIFRWLHPDIIFVMTVYFGYRKETIEGGLLTLGLAFILQPHTSGYNFFFFTLYIYTFVIAKVISKIYVIKSLLNASSIVAALYFIKQLGVWLLLYLEGRGSNAFWNLLTHLFPSLITLVLITPLLFSLFHELDLITYSDFHSDDELDLNREL